MRLSWLVVLALSACSSHAAESPPPQRAFYYWRTTFHLSDTEQRAITELGVTRLYVRVFDVDWDAATRSPQLIGRLTGDAAPAAVEIVPVVYFKNEVFKRLDRGGAAFARLVVDEVGRRMADLHATAHELQIDCDWTDSTRDRFFGFVRDLRATSKLPLSATIRLHQVKYREKTGVPPVERGMLMFYNMGKFSDATDDKAIFDEHAAEAYVDRIDDYPLTLDAALPIWSWVVHIRDGRVIDLLQSLDPDTLPDQKFLIPGGLDRYVATETTFLHGALLREGDVLKIERMGPRDTQAAAAMLSKHLAPATRSVALFDLSERNLQRHGQQLDLVYRTVR